MYWYMARNIIYYRPMNEHSIFQLIQIGLWNRITKVNDKVVVVENQITDVYFG